MSGPLPTRLTASQRERSAQLSLLDAITNAIGTDAASYPFLLDIVTADAGVSTAQQVAHRMNTTASTFMSRFVRHGLPSPHVLLRYVRLIRLRARLDDPTITITMAARALGFSSPQTCARMVRECFDLTPRQWREQSTTEGLIAVYVSANVTPHAATWRTFDPYQAYAMVSTRKAA